MVAFLPYLIEIMSFVNIKNTVEKKYNAVLVAVSKTRSNTEILNLYHSGQKIFGENRVQELVEKYQSLPKDIEWHLIGSLQKNKVKYIAPFVTMIHSVDDFELARTIHKAAEKYNRTIKVLLQIKIANETTKQGFEYHDLLDSLTNDDWSSLNHIMICGVMGMATFTENKKHIKEEFRNLVEKFHDLKNTYFHGSTAFNEISMGMSGDYLLALEEGSTMVRIGSAIFT